LIRPKKAETFGAPVPSPPFEVIGQTLRSVVRNEVILRPVVVKLGLDKEIVPEYSSWYERWYNEAKDFIKQQISNAWMLLKYGRILEESPDVKAIKGLRKYVNVLPAKDSYVYYITVRDKYPKRAAMIVDEIGKRLVQWLQEEGRSPAETQLTWLREQTIQKESEIESLHRERNELLQANGVASVSEEITKGLENLYQMEWENVQLNAQIERSKRKIAVLDKEIRTKKADYIQSEDYKKMRSDKLFEEVELEALKKQQSYQEASIKVLEEKLNSLPGLKDQTDTITMKIESSMREYQVLRDLSEEAFGLTNISTSEARVLHPAVVPVKPKQPIKIYHVGLSVFLALFLSVGILYVLDFLGIRIFYPPENQEGAATGSGGSTEKEAARPETAVSLEAETKSGDTDRAVKRVRSSVLPYTFLAGCAMALAFAVFYGLRKLGY